MSMSFELPLRLRPLALPREGGLADEAEGHTAERVGRCVHVETRKDLQLATFGRTDEGENAVG